MPLLAGLDIGTTKLSAVAMDAGGGGLSVNLSRPNSFNLEHPGRQDARELISAALDLLKSTSSRCGGPVEAIGITGQMHGIVFVDGDGSPTSPLFSWQDRSGEAVSPSGRTWVQEFTHRLGETLVEESGCIPSSGYGGITLLRLAREGSIPPGCRALCIHDLLVRSLTGKALTDPTGAASWGLLDVEAGKWLDDVCGVLGLPDRVLPEIAPTASQAGSLQKQAANALGLPAGIPVAVALGDNQASFLGSVPRPGGCVLMNLGTGGQMSIPLSSFTRAGRLETRPLIAGRYLLVGASLCGGLAYQVMRDFLSGAGREVFDINDAGDLYARMNELAAGAEPGAGGLRVRPAFSGSRIDPSSTGRIEGITLHNFTVSNLLRATLKGMVAELAGYYQQALSAGAKASVLVGSGNAARCIPVVREELQEQTGLSLLLPPNREAAACGAALAGGIAAGVFSNWDTALKIFRQPGNYRDTIPNSVK